MEKFKVAFFRVSCSLLRSHFMFTLSISQPAAKLFLENAGPRSSELLYVS